MEIKFVVTKEERKALVKAIAEITGQSSVYQGAPGFAFAVGDYVIDRNGTLVYDERTSEASARSLLMELAERGFIHEGVIDLVTPSNPENADVPDRLVIEVPFESHWERSFENLERLVSGKSALIMKALGVDSLPIERTENTLRFAWFPVSAGGEETDAYARFVHALCDMAKNQKRVTMKEKESAVDSEKFAFRCFLLRLGFIGGEYASARKILLAKLPGSSAFKSGDHKSRDTQKDVKLAADMVMPTKCEGDFEMGNAQATGEEEVLV